MKCFVPILIILTILALLLACSAAKDNFPDLKGPYLGQKPPGITPEIFAPGIISTHLSQSYIAFLKGARVCVFSTSTERGHETYYTYEKDGFWTKPERAPFEELQGHPNYTTGPLGRKVYYHSGNPTHPDDTIPDDNIWSIEWTGSGWAKPEALPPPANSEHGEAYPSATADGTVYFFTWRREGARGDDIWFSRCIDGKYQEAERLPWPINSDFIEYDPYVAPDESFLIFGSDRPGGYGNSDNYICFRKDDGSWTSLINLGRPYNSTSYDLCANGTPDGKYFFFTSGRKTDVDKGEIGLISGKKPKDDADLYWTDFSFIEDLKNTLFNKQNAAKIIKKDYVKNGIQSAVNTLNRLYNDQKDSTYFLPFELLSLTKDMLLEDEIKDADLFCSALEKLFPKDFSIKAGYARLCAVNGYVSKGLKIFEELDSKDPKFDLNDALSSLGYLFTLYPEKTQDALSVLQFTVEKFPEDPWAYFSLARVYRQLGDLDKAIENCRKSLELEPDVGDISQMLERLLQEKEKQEKRSLPVLKGSYLGQKPPGLTAEIFAPNLISTGQHEALYGFFNDGTFLIFDRTDPSEKVWIPAVYVMELREGGWITTEGSPFLGKPWYHYYTIAPEEKTVYFAWKGSLNNVTSSSDINIWRVIKTKDGWDEPTKLPFPVNSLDLDTCPSITNEGTLYFFSTREGGFGKGDIYRSRLNNGSHTEVENLGQTINTEYSDIDPFIAPDESCLIFCSNRPGGCGGLDFYISFQMQNGAWTEPVNMGEGINSAGNEERPKVTPDGKYIFLTRDTSGNLDIFWVDARIIEDLKPKELKQNEIPFRADRLSERVLFIKGGNSAIISNSTAVATSQGLVVIDSNYKPEFGQKIRRLIEKAFDRNDFTHLIYTHAGVDHMGGASAFPGALVVGHNNCITRINGLHDRLKSDDIHEILKPRLELLNAKLNAGPADEAERFKLNEALFYWNELGEMLASGFEYRLPTLTFDDEFALHLGDITIKLRYCTPGYSESDTLIYIPEEKLLVVGDIFNRDRIPLLHERSDVKRWLDLFEPYVKGKKEVKYIIGGHDEMMSLDELKAQYEYLKDLWEGVKVAKKEGLTLEKVKESYAFDQRYSHLSHLNIHWVSSPDNLHERNIECIWKIAEQQKEDSR